jgi:hypothetical protein
MIGGVWNDLSTIDLGAMIMTFDMCREHKWGVENTCAGENLRINAFYGFFQGFQVDTTMGLDQMIF